jgi:hypothetical protein
MPKIEFVIIRNTLPVGITAKVSYPYKASSEQKQ